MDNFFWATFQELKYKEYFYTCYLRKTELIENTLTAIGLVFSAASIAGWGIWNNVPYIWSALLAVAQVLQVIKPALPYAKRRQGIKYMILKISMLMVELTDSWNKCSISQDLSDGELRRQANVYLKRFTELENLFMSSECLPNDKAVAAQAAVYRDNFFLRFYNIEPKKKEDSDANKTAV